MKGERTMKFQDKSTLIDLIKDMVTSPSEEDRRAISQHAIDIIVRSIVQ